MPVVRKAVTVPANGTVENAFDGSLFLYLPWNASINLGTLAQSAGVTATFITGSDVVMEESPVDVLADKFPKIPDDMDIQDVAGRGQLMVLKLRNSTGSPIIARFVAQIQPI